MIVERNQLNFDISIILPSRKRLEGLNNTLFSILETADSKNVNFEIIIKVDFDDLDTIDYVKKWDNEFENITFIINSRRGGWLNMTDYVENMIDISKGKWILNVNDDVIFKTQNWNTSLINQRNEFKIYFPKTDGYPQSFPIYPKKLQELFVEGEEIIFYNDIVDCINKINYYKTHSEERENIAKRGQEKALKHHTQKQRVNKILELCKGGIY